MRDGKIGLRNLGLAILGGLIILQDGRQSRQSDPLPIAQPLTAVPAKHPDTDVLLDRMATRFGAFAVVATVNISIFQAANAVRLADEYQLPSVMRELPDGAVYVTFLLSWIMMGIAVALALLAFSPVFAFIKNGPILKNGPWWTGLLLAPLFAVGVVIYLVVVIMMQTLPDLNSLGATIWDMTREMDSVCAKAGLRGQICEDALNALR